MRYQEVHAIIITYNYADTTNDTVYYEVYLDITCAGIAYRSFPVSTADYINHHTVPSNTSSSGKFLIKLNSFLLVKNEKHLVNNVSRELSRYFDTV